MNVLVQNSKKIPLTLPKHVAVIMDGNGRWAQALDQPRAFGHMAGVEAINCAIRFMLQQKIPYLTLYALSFENINRPAAEVDFLWKLFKQKILEQSGELYEQNILVQFLGNYSCAPDDVLQEMHELEQKTADNSGLVLSIAVAYSGRWDILQACRKLAQQVMDNQLAIDRIDYQSFSEALSTNQLPEPDIMLRTGGQLRLSNFLLWQTAYTELFFSDKNWPDYDEQDWHQLLSHFHSRRRTFGLLDDEK